MSRKRHSTDQIIGTLRQADVEPDQGKTGRGGLPRPEDHGPDLLPPVS